MTDDTKLPRGIRNNNPGNLRSGYGMGTPVPKEDGFARFATMEDGLYSMAMLVSDFYNVTGLRTLPAFIGRYAPSTENDVTQYMNLVSQRLGLNPLSRATHDLQLNQGWRAFDFMRAIIQVECGRPSPSLPSYPEWIRPSELLSAMIRTRKWAAL